MKYFSTENTERVSHLSEKRPARKEVLPEYRKPRVGCLFLILAMVIFVGDHVPIVVSKMKALNELRFSRHEISEGEEEK